MNYNELAEFLFPHITKTPDDYEKAFPKRDLPENAMVTRLAPSPTGFIHLGNLFGAFADERLAHQSNGVFYLRIEDTDHKRFVEGATETIINSLSFFNIQFDEGATKNGEIGDFAPYYQSNRGEIYQTFVKSLVAQGLAYPCFMTSEELEEIRAIQEKNKENFGIYGKWAKNRDLSFDEIKEKISSGAEYVIRLRSSGNLDLPEEEIRRITVNDGIRGELSMPENDQDVVILKSTGIPTYHFAHIIDDHLMRTTHVIRGGEWLSTLPIHVELFEKLHFPLPIFCHTAHLMKIDEDGKKRKLSKRKDPELALTYYQSEGYMPSCLREYLMTILNSNYEEWRLANPDAPLEDFQFSLETMNSSGALFDLNKLNDVSKEVILKTAVEDLYEFLFTWIKEFRPEDADLFEDKEFICQILNIGRNDAKPRKDLVYAKQIFHFINYFFDKYFAIAEPLPANVSKEDALEILKRYKETYQHSDDQSNWFEKIRTITADLGYATRPKDFKKNPELYKGHVGDVSTVVRLAIVGRSQSPDVWSIQQILGEEKTMNRIEAMIQTL